MIFDGIMILTLRIPEWKIRLSLAFSIPSFVGILLRFSMVSPTVSRSPISLACLISSLYSSLFNLHIVKKAHAAKNTSEYKRNENLIFPFVIDNIKKIKNAQLKKSVENVSGDIFLKAILTLCFLKKFISLYLKQYVFLKLTKGL